MDPTRSNTRRRVRSGQRPNTFRTSLSIQHAQSASTCAFLVMPHSTQADIFQNDVSSTEDVILSDAPIEASSGKPASNSDIKVEDLFNEDEDGDDEAFSSLAATTDEVESGLSAVPMSE